MENKMREMGVEEGRGKRVSGEDGVLKQGCREKESGKRGREKG